MRGQTKGRRRGKRRWIKRRKSEIGGLERRGNVRSKRRGINNVRSKNRWIFNVKSKSEGI